MPELFRGKQIIVALAGTSETQNVQSKQQMDDMLLDNGVLKWVEEERFSDHDTCSPCPVQGDVFSERSSSAGSGAGVASCTGGSGSSGGSGNSGGSSNSGGSGRGSAAWGCPLGGFFTHGPSRRRMPPTMLHRSSPATPRRTPVLFMLRGQASAVVGMGMGR